jgi:hypothetical protein
MPGCTVGECGSGPNSQTESKDKYLSPSKPLKKGYSIPCWAVVPIKEFECIKHSASKQGITFSQWMYAAVQEKLKTEEERKGKQS